MYATSGSKRITAPINKDAREKQLVVMDMASDQTLNDLLTAILQAAPPPNDANTAIDLTY